jgi:hypothetical protein
MPMYQHQVPIRIYQLLSLSSFLTRERSSSNMNSIRKKLKRKLPRTKGNKERLALVQINTSLTSTTFLVVTRTLKDTLLVNVLSKTYMQRVLNISNIENSKLLAPETINPNKTTLNRNLRIKWTQTGVERTATGVICPERILVQVNTTMMSAQQTGMLTMPLVTDSLPQL